MKLINYLRTLLRPRPVSAILADATKLVDELKNTAEVQGKRADHHYAEGDKASAEAAHAHRVAGKLSALLS